MVNEHVLIRDKHAAMKRVFKVLIIIFAIVLILLIVFAAGFLFKKPVYVEVTFVNPLADIILANTDNVTGVVDEVAVIEQAVIEFNEDYINYILAALGTGYLHKSVVGGVPVIELDMEGDVWSAEIIDGVPNSKNQAVDNEDLQISISKEEAVKAILSDDIEQFMKDSVNRGDTQIEMVAGKPELFAKGYLDMYKALTGNEIAVE